MFTNVFLPLAIFCWRIYSFQIKSLWRTFARCCNWSFLLVGNIVFQSHEFMLLKCFLIFKFCIPISTHVYPCIPILMLIYSIHKFIYFIHMFFMRFYYCTLSNFFFFFLFSFFFLFFVRIVLRAHHLKYLKIPKFELYHSTQECTVQTLYCAL